MWMRVALVTGSSSGNGRAIALRLARDGCAVVCADLVEAPDGEGFAEGRATHEAIAAAGGQARFVPCDVRDGEQVAAAVGAAVESFGRLDVSVANAGVSPSVQDLPDEPWEDYLRTIEINQHGVWWTCRESARQLRAQGEGGRIVVLGSIASLVGFHSGVHYNASKGAVLQITRTLAAQLGPDRITVNAVCPGYIRTAMTRVVWEDEARLQRAIEDTPMRMLGEPEDVAAAVCFLASPDARWITGVALPVDGGWTCV
jgi:NAD(P)-dependent dehydrogenase (short-subunit alcohol dehydrogenase family)